MKNVLLLLLLAVAGSLWAFRARDIAPTRYIMVIRDLERTGYTDQPRPSLTVIEPDGSFKTEELPVVTTALPKAAIQATIVKGATTDSTSTRLRRFRYANNFIYRAEVRKLNELSAQGWVLVSTVETGTTTRYLLRKD